MRIVLVTRRYPPLIGGAEKVLSYLAQAFAEAGAEVTVLTSGIDPSLPAVERPLPNLEVVRLKTSRLRFFGTWLYMRNLARWFARNRVDAAYVSMLKHDAFVVAQEGIKRGFPVVLRPEGAGATGDLAWQKWGRGGARIGAVCKKASAVVAISAAVRSELLAEGYDADRIIDLPNGVPVPEEAWDGSKAEPDSAVFVGRLAPEKGLDTLIEAWKFVVGSRPEARLTLVGDGPERSRLEALAESLGVSNAVRFPGASSQPSEVLRRSSLFVLPSREEGMSIALLEAMALGMPIVASDIPGNRKLVTAGEHGRLAPPDRPEALASAILDAWNNPEASLALGRAARFRVESEYTIQAVVRRHLDLFERLRRGVSVR